MTNYDRDNDRRLNSAVPTYHFVITYVLLSFPTSFATAQDDSNKEMDSLFKAIVWARSCDVLGIRDRDNRCSYRLTDDGVVIIGRIGRIKGKYFYVSIRDPDGWVKRTGEVPDDVLRQAEFVLRTLDYEKFEVILNSERPAPSVPINVRISSRPQSPYTQRSAADRARAPEPTPAERERFEQSRKENKDPRDWKVMALLAFAVSLAIRQYFSNRRIRSSSDT